ncbi:TIGR02302 family protein [Roseivivax halotolerans]|uniref:TIGR02302 family protein n=1 Tax=Roseivivax halotolerans TaxID=93684 RepID=A0A1I5V6C3_9RHOB|nr:TIGR02302 family protein [Roseivivax halotolerans]SFQ02942.1 TIGR02302 family protein [Roseivivax halotolerans]
MADQTIDPNDIIGRVKRPLALTRAGLVAERAVRAFWPLWSVVFAVVAMLMLGLQDFVSATVVLIVAVLALGLAGWTLWRGVSRFTWPSREDALIRLDATMPGHPITTSLDRQAIGAGDGASAAVWNAHQARMRARLAEAKAVEPDLRVSDADPYALRYAALLALAVALLFGSVMRVSSVAGIGPGGASDLATGPSWEGWVEPPAYTRLPTIYLNDITDPELSVPEGSSVTLRLYGEVGALSVSETVSGNPLAQEDGVDETARDFSVETDGRIAIDGPNGRAWDIAVTEDAAPEVDQVGRFDVKYDGEASLSYEASDDYEVTGGTATVTLALDEVDRRYGREIEPEQRDAIEVPLPLPVAGDRSDFEETLIDNFSQHPWANLPVNISFEVTDAAGQVGASEANVQTLPGRRFFEPMAAALIEERQALLWNRENADDIALIMRAISHEPDGLFRQSSHYLRFRTILRRLEASAEDGMSDEEVAETAAAMWDLAIVLEEGDLDDARERLQRAQERLTEAMRNGASEDEIAELMQELRRATDDYMRQLAQEQRRTAEENGESPSQDMQNGMQMTQNDLQEMMDRIQELMEEGRMAEAMQAMEELQRLMENMRVTEGQGQGQQSPGQQAMEGLGETLREQQELSDQAFEDLQEQFNPGQNRQGQQGQQGQDGQQQGQGQQPGQQNQGRGEGQQQGQGQGQGQGEQQGQQGQGGGQSLEESLADRQRSLRGELNRQRQNMPGDGSEAGRRAGEALDRAEGAMEGAEDALREDDLAGAIDRQSEAMEALREGMRNLGEAMAEQQGQQPGEQGQQGMADGTDPGQQRDPLGRSAGSNGQIGSDEQMLQGEDVYRRARELLDEIRRRSGEGERPEEELEYLERLLERF